MGSKNGFSSDYGVGSGACSELIDGIASRMGKTAAEIRDPLNSGCIPQVPYQTGYLEARITDLEAGIRELQETLAPLINPPNARPSKVCHPCDPFGYAPYAYELKCLSKRVEQMNEWVRDLLVRVQF